MPVPLQVFVVFDITTKFGFAKRNAGAVIVLPLKATGSLLIGAKRKSIGAFTSTAPACVTTLVQISITFSTERDSDNGLWKLEEFRCVSISRASCCKSLSLASLIRKRISKSRVSLLSDITMLIRRCFVAC